MKMVPLQVHTAFMELQDASLAFESCRKLGFQFGSIHKKRVGKDFFYYYQYPASGASIERIKNRCGFVKDGRRHQRQAYLFPGNRGSVDFFDRFQDGKVKATEKIKVIKNLASMVKAGGMMALDTKTFKIIKAFGDGGVFSRGGVLIGTNAFIVIGNMLGFQMEHRWARTLDIDFACDCVKIASSPQTETMKVWDLLESLEMGFHPLFPSPPKKEVEKYKANEDHFGIEVEFLTPLIGRDTDKPNYLELFGVYAQRLRFLDYIIEQTQKTCVVGNTGSVQVNVPNASRFAFHKLIVAGRRPEREQAKIRKDVGQARQLFEFLLENRPEDLNSAREALSRFGWLKHVRQGLMLMGNDHDVIASKIQRDFDV